MGEPTRAQQEQVARERDERIAELEADAQRLEKLFRAVRDALGSLDGLEQLTHAFGDAPATCGCREAHCPHEPIAPGIDSIREMVDAAPIGWTYAELAQQARDDACTDCGAPPDQCECGAGEGGAG